MPLRIVQSKQNSRLKELRRALTRPGRESNEQVGIEGPNLLAEAARAELRFHFVFAAHGNERFVEQLALPSEVEVLLMPPEVLNSALATEAPQPVAALVEPPDWTWAHLLGTQKGPATLIVVLAEVQDPGNLGTILRSAEAFGASGILSLPGTVNVWNPKAVRASAGSVFRVPLLAVGAIDAFRHLREAGIKILATSTRAAQPADLVDLAEPVAFVIGNEGAGVPSELAAKSHETITIPCPGKVESLNAAVAASVLLYEASRQRSMKSGGPVSHLGGLR
jgi:RNA methyltransferase, TrmH family